MRALLEGVIASIENHQTRPSGFRAVVGFDGYVDRIQRVVSYREGIHRQHFSSISQFAQHQQALAGKSGQIELETKILKMGGNGPILANALANLGVDNDLIGTLGHPDIHPVFQQMHDGVRCISIGAPAETNALEFEDGKIILSEVSPFDELSWEQLKQQVGEERLLQWLGDADCGAFVDWANLPLGTALWRGISHHLMPQLKQKPKFILFDLCDPSKRSANELIEVLECISSFSTHTEVVLGLNENETLNLYQRLWPKVNSAPDLLTIGRQIRKRFDIDQFLIHPVDRALLIGEHEHLELPGRVVKQPKLLTGAGDNLNAGFCLAKLLGMSPQHQLICAMATSGAYVANGESPTPDELCNYLRLWRSER